ncbi:hypothetical protein JI735_22565 [Paenibacillus sonchi]|uniref:Uncharacterized protein n=1 Tax=Paenibacillus sonchi TaxID=373687 RepID=A0A974P8W5_9BACL|nr:hypothetical protein [Paenibacillus sonchi]QQZ59420.1 hypothetical protein JI735_22565 [Paenibacillus sonchi]
MTRDDEFSVWRVDDGGEITSGMFSLLFAARTANGVALGVNWRGAEGVNSFSSPAKRRVQRYGDQIRTVHFTFVG